MLLGSIKCINPGAPPIIICSRSQTNEIKVHKKIETMTLPFTMSRAIFSVEKRFKIFNEKKEEINPEKTIR